MNYKEPVCSLCYRLMGWQKDVEVDCYGEVRAIHTGWYCGRCGKWIDEVRELSMDFPKRNSFPKKIRDEIIAKNPRCAKCSKTEKLTIDHIYPRSRGGLDLQINLQVLCRSCNLSKSHSI